MGLRSDRCDRYIFRSTYGDEVARKRKKPTPLCDGFLRNGPSCLSVALKGSRFCQHHSRQEVARWLAIFEEAPKEQRTIEVPVFEQETFEYEQLVALGQYLAEHYPNLTTETVLEAA
jgi:hypothetical protein